MLAPQTKHPSTKPPSTGEYIAESKRLCQRNELDRAIEIIKVARRIYPHNVFVAMRLGELYADKHMAAEALAAYDDALALAKTNFSELDFRHHSGSIHSSKALVYFRQKNFRAALDEFALSRDPERHNLHREGKYAETLFCLNRMAEGWSVIERARQRDAEHPAILKAAVRGFQKDGRFGDSLGLIDRLIRLNPGNPKLAVDRGLNHLMLRKFAEAEQDFAKAKKMRYRSTALEQGKTMLGLMRRHPDRFYGYRGELLARNL